MARCGVLFVGVLCVLCLAHGRQLASSSNSQYATVGSSSSAVAYSSKGKTLVKAGSKSAAFSHVRNAASVSIASALASIVKGESVEAQATAVAVATSKAIAEAYASSYATVLVSGKGYGKGSANANAQAFAKAVATAYAEAFAQATKDRYTATAEAIAFAISKGVAHALVHTRITVKVGQHGYASAAKEEHVRAIAHVIAAAFADAFAEVKTIGYYGVTTSSSGTAIADSFVEDKSTQYSKGYAFSTGNASVVSKSTTVKHVSQVPSFSYQPW